MSGGLRVPLAEASLVAEQLAGVVGIGCERAVVAGSIRRRAETAGDIEIVAVPRLHNEVIADGLFEQREIVIDELQVVIDTLLMDGTLANHPDDPKRGPRYSKLLHPDSGMQVDLFSARHDTFGMAFLIRTGPDTYSKWLVQEARRRHFHVAHGMELHRGSFGCGTVPCEVVPTLEEDDVFRALAIHPAGPESRG